MAEEVKALGINVVSMEQGGITRSEQQSLVAMIEICRKACDTAELAAHIAALEEA